MAESEQSVIWWLEIQMHSKQKINKASACPQSTAFAMAHLISAARKAFLPLEILVLHFICVIE
jgi:hypothetical protein